MDDIILEWLPMAPEQLENYQAGRWAPAHVRETEHGVEWGMEWIAGRITVDEGYTVVDGQYRANTRWNGWLCPRMKADACEQVLAGIAELEPYNFIFMLDGDDYIMWDRNYEDTFHPGSGVCDALEVFWPDENGWYYPGHMGWCWESGDQWDRRNEEES